MRSLVQGVVKNFVQLEILGFIYLNHYKCLLPNGYNCLKLHYANIDKGNTFYQHSAQNIT